MGSTSYVGKPKNGVYKARSGSSVGSDKDMNGKLRRTKIRRPSKMNEYGLKRIPDYTELAYKEAVSKLRYFLSGNYSPSIRSYGGSASIKNLDESDGDLDKKYSPYTALHEFKPRPRLTTKYTTLYADSLKNYTPNVHLTNVSPSTPAAVASELTGGTNPDVVNFIQKQEEYIEQLERESQYCRDELNNLLGKVKEVISENEHLHEAQKNKLISRMFHTYNAGSETDELDELGDSTGLDSDNKVTPSKTRKSSKPRGVKLEGPNIVFESRIAELEAQLTQSKIDLKKLQEENNENKRKLASGLVDSTCLDGFKRQIDNLQRDKSSLESQISKLKLTLEQREGDIDGRYKRGSDAIEQQLREERNNLEAELRRLKDELAKERSKVRELAGEGARRAIQERSAAEQRYNEHFDELSHDLAAQYDNVSKLQLELERQRRDDNDLKREISMKTAAIEELKMELKNKTSSLQADLAQAYAEKASVEEELASARLAIERHQRQAKHETNRLNSEIQSLRQRLDRADADLVHSRRENLRLSEQIATLEKELNMKNLTPMSPEKNKNDKELSSMLESMENKHAKTVAELEAMIHSQNSLMEKLTGECRLLTDKLDDANRRHKEELATLHRQVEILGQSLHQPSTPDTYYQAPSPHASRTYGNVEHPSTSPGSNYTRVDTSRNPQISRQHSKSELGEHGVHSNSQSRALSRQTSRSSVRLENTLPEHTAEPENIKPYENTHEDVTEKDIGSENPLKEEYAQQNINHDVNKTLGETQNQQYETSYSENQPNYEVDQSNYDQNYAQDYVTENADYQVQGYDQNYQLQGYPEGQYQEQYEQYPPQQQYTDPNSQYEGQYENYEADPNFQNVQSYDNQEYTPSTEEYTSQSQPVTEDPIDQNEDSKRSNSPNVKVANKS